MLRTSERLSFKTCEQQWWWNFSERLRPTTDRPALWFGDLIHQSMERYYHPGKKRGPHPAKTFEKLFHKRMESELVRLKIRTPEDEWFDPLELGVGMLNAYVERYKERDDEYEVIASEQTFQVPILDDDGKQVAIYVGTFDGIWRKKSDRRLWFKEFKTTGDSIKKITSGPLAMDEQAGGYWTYGPDWLREQGLLKPKEDLDGIIYTFLRKALRPEGEYNELGQKLNKDGSVSKQQPAENFGRVPVYRDRANRELMRERVMEEVKRMNLIRSGELTPIKNPGKLFMPNCQFCSFRDMCELHESGQDWEEMKRQTMTSWDPYAAHEIKIGDRT